MVTINEILYDEKPEYQPRVDVNDLDLKLYRNTWVRKDQGVDSGMVKESQENYNVFSYDENSIVMDLGANIGGFTRMALQHPIKKFIGVEPDPTNLAVAKKNAEDALCECVWYEGVTTIGTEKDLVFYQSASKNSKCSGTIDSKSNVARRKGGSSYLVKNYNIYELLEEHKPTHVKVDIEGAEIDWLLDCKGFFPSHIQQMSFEVHRKRGMNIYSDFYDRISEDFNHIKITPNVGFAGGTLEEFPKLGISWAGRVWGADIFITRKT